MRCRRTSRGRSGPTADCVRLLLDTHTLLWWWSSDSRLGAAALAAVASAEDVAVSVASVWEIEIKRALGRLAAPSDVIAGAAADGFVLLAIDAPHVVGAARLPQHHRDPFDRVLVAQARIEQRILVTGDARLAAYDVDRLAAS